ncbi:hypothetical protein QQ054_19035 [Oscillatoria amoena NRMC-F 0135]|nr:hypothetical protein [Oscillatoria amoena NRMC-F 0135]
MQLVIDKMRFITLLIPLILFGCKQNQQQSKNNDIAPHELKTEEDRCRKFYDSLVALADTPVVDSEDDYDYKDFYISKLVSNKYYLSYTRLTFTTGNRKWDKQLYSFFENEIENERKRWVSEYRNEWPDSIPVFWQNLLQCTINITPVFVSRNWVTVWYHTEDYLGGAHGTLSAYFLHLYNDHGKLRRITQPDVFIYGRDSLVRKRFYSTLFKGIDNKVQWEKITNCPDVQQQNLIGKYQIRLDLLMEPDQFAKRETNPAYYLIPTSRGLKTTRCARWPQPKEYDTTRYIDDIIIPYNNFEGIIKQEYLNAWQHD